jgi:aspartate aminotransferase-like enzyme
MRAHGLVIAGGQGKWAGKILRFGHMGDVGMDEMGRALHVMGDLLPYFGHTADAAGAARAAHEEFDAALAAAR